MKIKVCPYSRIKIPNWYQTENIETNECVINYFLKTKNNEFIDRKSNLKKDKNYVIKGKYHYEFIWQIYDKKVYLHMN